MRAHQVFLALGIVVVAHGSSAGSEGLDVKRAQRLIAEHGARQALRLLFGDLKAEVALADGIATGRPEWLAIAAKLRPVSDAAGSETLSLAIQEALPRNPLGVLRLVQQGVFHVKHACGMYGFGQIEDDRPTNLILGLVDRRLEAVAALAEPQLNPEREACLRELERLRSRLEETLPARPW